MKVVIEGALYDLDLDGEISIIDRNDIINTAKLHRKYEVIFKSVSAKLPICSFNMESTLENLAAELLPTHQSERLAGCHIQIKYTMNIAPEFNAYQDVFDTISHVWGKERIIEQEVRYNPLDLNSMKTLQTIILFDRLVFEEQIDDLVEMVDYMVLTLNNIAKTFQTK